MKREGLSIGKEFVISVVIHALILGGAATLFCHLGQDSPSMPVVFLSTDLPGGNEGGGSTKVSSEEKPAPLAQTKKRVVSRKKRRKCVSVAKKDIVDTQVPDIRTVEDVPQAPLVSDLVSKGRNDEGKGSAGTGGGGFGYGIGGKGGSGGGTGRGHGTGPGDANILAEQYLAKHFAYIRNLIMKHLKYPLIARRMGWKGRVTVAFVIKENGGVEGSRILASSGYEVLDRQVLKVIGEIQPFPRPPTKAELIMPVVYRLE